MKVKKTIILLTLVVFLLSLANVYAGEMDDALASEDASQIGVSSTVEDNLQASEENAIVEQTGNHYADKLSSSGEFDELQKLIDNASDNGIINLEHNYTYTIGADTITEGIGISKNLTINGNGFAIDAQGKSRIFNIDGGTNVLLNNIIFTNGFTEGNGGAILAYGNVNIAGSSFINNTAVDGGAVESFNAKMTISESYFTSNNATEYGGAIYNFNSDVELSDLYFEDNYATEYGGAIYNFRGNVNVTQSQFTRNAAGSKGGAVLNSFGSVNIADTNFSENTAAVNGGAVYFASADNVTNCIFTNNTAGKSGGAVYVDEVYNASKIDSTFIDNHANNGGAVYFNGGISNVTISGLYKGNVAQRGGGAIFVRENSLNSTFTADFIANEARAASGGAVFIYNQADNNSFDGSFADNYALYGGAIFFYNKANSNVFNSEFLNNTAKSCGGAMFFHNTTDGNNFTGDFTGNSALGEVDESVGNGGAITFKDTSSNSIFTCDFVNNTANLNGGGVNYRHTPHNITFNSNFINNTSPRGGGVNFFETFENVIFNGEFIGNSAVKGGAIATVEGSIEGVSFTDNRAEEGGAVYFASAGNVTNCNFINNTASKSGGAVYFGSASSDSKINSTFMGNNANNGGAIYFNGEISNVTIGGIYIGNVAQRGGGAIFVRGKSMNNNFTADFIANEARAASGGAIFIYNQADNNTFEGSYWDNYAIYGGAIFFYNKANGNVFNSEFTNNTAKSCGGAIFFYNTTDGNNFTGDFTGNSALGEVDESVGNGGAITFKDTSSNSIFACDFINNTANLNGGGVNYRQTPYNITFNSNFINNTSPRGGGVNFFETFENVSFIGTFIGNSAVKGGAIATVEGSIEGVTFTDNRAEEGGAVYINGTGEVSNCIFTNNTATDEYSGGGAVYIGSGNVTDSIFISNRATSAGSLGGAVLIKNSANVTGCSFEDNFAGFGGAVADEFNVNVNNCDFTANRASVEGGALYMGSGNIVNSNFANNNASDEDSEGDGGAVYVDRNVTVVNCNFTGNKAYRGSAIYFWVIGDFKYVRSISHSTFLNNRASIDSLSPFTLKVNENNIEIAFEGYDNLLNAILSRKMSDVNITNVTYWGANGVENTGDATIVPAMLYTEAGQNVTVSGLVNGEPLNVSAVTNAEGKIVLNISAGDNYFLTVRHDADSYYSEGEKTFTNIAFNVNVVSQTTSNRTVNLTAESNIYGDAMPGNLVFILPNGTQINATYGGNGTWWAMHTFDECAVYKVNASYVGLENVAVRNATVTVLKALSKFSDVVVMSNNVTLTLCDENGNPISGANITYAIDGVSNATVSDNNGSFVIIAASGAEIFVDYAGSDDYVGSNITIKLTTPQRQSTVIVGEDFTQYACDYYVGERGNNFTVQLTDADGNPIANKTVYIGYNGVTLNRTTDANGFANVQINLKNAGLYTFVVVFLDDNDYNASMKVFKVTINKKPTSISASAKTFKVSAKTKKYTVTLKTIKGASIDGKTYLASGKKVTLKVNGKTYTAKTNAKGQATFSIKITKKGKFTAVIKYAGDNTYKSASKKVKITIK